MLQIAIPSVLQQSTVSIGMMIVQAVVNPFGTQALAGYSATMRVENVFSLILYPSAMRFHRIYPRTLGKENRTAQKRLSCGTGVRSMFRSPCFSGH